MGALTPMSTPNDSAVDAARPSLEQARGRAYALLGGLIRDGLRGAPDELWTLPELAPFAPASADDRDRLEAGHHRLFSLELAPYATVWMETTLLAGDDAHLGSLVVRLGGSEGRDAAATLDGLLPWGLDLVAASERLPGGTGMDLWRHLLRLFLETAAEHRRALPAPPAPPALPPSPWPDLDTPFPHVIRGLAVPLRAGAFLTRCDLLGLARRLELPVGFGPRRELLRTMGDAASHYGDPARLIDGLDALLASADEGREGLARALGLAPWAVPWADRLQEARRRLADRRPTAR